MVVLLEVVGKNFLSFEQIDFPLNHQRLVAILGENRDSAVASSNGSGKSAIFDLIHFALFGKPLRSIRVEEIIKKGQSWCFAAISFLRQGHVFVIERYRNHPTHKNNVFFTKRDSDGLVHSLNDDNNKNTQQIIDKALGMDSALFRSLVLFGRNGSQRFSELSDREKKELLERVLNLQTWDKASQEAQRSFAFHVEQAKRIQQSLSIEEAKIAQISEMCLTLEKTASKQEARFLEECKQHTETSERLALLVATPLIPPLFEPLALLHIKNAITDNQQQQDRLHSYAEEKLSPLKDARLLKTAALQSLQDEMFALKAISLQLAEGAVCSSCGQSLTSAHVAHKVSLLFDKQKGLEQEVQRIQQEINAVVQAYENVLLVLEEQQGRLKSDLKQAEQAQAEQQRQEVFFARKLEERAQQEKHLKHLLRNPPVKDDSFDTMLAAQRIALQQAKDRATLAKDSLQQANREASHFEALTQMFGLKGMRSLVFEQALPRINERLQYYASLLSEGWLKVEISSQSQTAKGDVRESISLVVSSQSGGSSYESCSAGEQRRLDLPIALALQDVAASQGLSMGLCLFDEVFENVDEKGVESLINLLDVAQKRIHSQTMFVITHNQETSSRFDSVVRVVKERRCSFVVDT